MFKRAFALSIFFTLACSLSPLVTADNLRKFQIDIPPGELVAALKLLTKQSGVDLVYRTDQVQGIITKGVKGELSPKEAVARLLDGTALKANIAATGAMLIAAPTGGDSVNESASPGASEGWKMAQGNALGASTTSSSAGDAVGQREEEKIGEIIVTAQRRSEALDKVPMSVSALSQQELDDLHIISLQDLSSVVPGLILHNPSAGAQAENNIAIRGISSQGNSPTTVLYIDETPLIVRQNSSVGDTGTPQPDLFDLDRIEVLRGPQGTLFGSSAMGGVIRFISPNPSLESSSGYAKAETSYTERGAPSYAVGVAYGAPIVQDAAGFRISGWFRSDGGFVDVEDPYTGQITHRNANSSMSSIFRPAFTIVPADNVSVTAAVYVRQFKSDDPDNVWVSGLPNANNGAFTSGYGNVPQPNTQDIQIPSLAVTYNIGRLTLQFDTSYLHISQNSFDDFSNLLGYFEGLPLIDPALSSFRAFDDNVDTTNAFQQEFRLTSPSDGRLTWVLGAYYRRSSEEVAEWIRPGLEAIISQLELTNPSYASQLQQFPNFVYNGQEYNGYSTGHDVTDERSVFGDVDFKITSRLKASVGLRVEKSVLKHQTEAFAGPFDFVNYHVVTLPDDVEHPVTPRYSLTYQYTDNHMVYATAAKGYRVGGSNSPQIIADGSQPACAPDLKAYGLTSVPATYKSDSLWSYEIGSKDAFFDRRLVFQASVYYINWSNIQSNINLPTCSQAFSGNAGNVVSQGFDFQLQARITDSLKVGATVGYDNEYYPKAQYFGPSPTNPPIDAAGDKVGIVPWTAAVVADYRPKIAWLWDAAQPYIRLDYRWTDAQAAGDPNAAEYNPYPDHAYSMVNVRAGVVRSSLDVSLFVDNATDARPLLDRGILGSPEYLTASVLRPRTFGLTAFYRWGGTNH